jgi:hypothetical protein
MKKPLLLSIIILIVIKVYGQDFAPIGATWFYTEYYAFSGNIDYLKIESFKDTIVNEKNCRKLIKNIPLGCTGRGFTEIVYQKESRVYFYDSDFNEFQVLFDLKSEKDSSWFIKFLGNAMRVDTLFVIVDSTDNIEINLKNLKRLYVTYMGTYNGDTVIQYTSQIIETIGDVSYLFNLYPDWSVACDMNYSDGLRCYSDDIFGSYETGIADSCTYTYTWTKINNVQTDPYLRIYPNPARDEISILSNIDKILKVSIKDFNGRIYLSQDFVSDTHIDVSRLTPGIYIMTITGKNGFFRNEKITKY